MRAKVIAFIGISVVTTSFWVIIIIYALRFTLPYNPLRLPYDNKKTSTLFKTILPEGFGFFTRNPRESSAIVYKWLDSNIKLETIPNASFENLLGLSKRSRCQNLETGNILSKINSKDWLECKATLKECANYSETPILYISNGYLKPLLCGDYIIVMQDPVPWAWSASIKPNIMPIYFVRVNIRCN